MLKYQPFHTLDAQTDGSGYRRRKRKRRCREIEDRIRRERGKEDGKEVNAEENKIKE
jgi:hypothetical protein